MTQCIVEKSLPLPIQTSLVPRFERTPIRTLACRILWFAHVAAARLESRRSSPIGLANAAQDDASARGRGPHARPRCARALLQLGSPGVATGVGGGFSHVSGGAPFSVSFQPGGLAPGRPPCPAARLARNSQSR